MRAMILLAHGSKKKESILEIETMATQIETYAKQNGQFDFVKAAFMQFCGPNFYQAMDALIQKARESTTNQDSFTTLIEQNSEIKEVVVLPYFISAGSHVLEDIPELIVEVRKKYPNITFTTTPHLGQFKRLERLILEETALQNR